MLAGPPPAPRALDATIARPLEAIILRAMAREPGARYAGAAAMADDLQRWLEGRPVAAYGDGVLEKLARWTRKHRRIVVPTGIALTVGLVAAGVALERARTNLAMATRNRAQALHEERGGHAWHAAADVVETPTAAKELAYD